MGLEGGGLGVWRGRGARGTPPAVGQSQVAVGPWHTLGGDGGRGLQVSGEAVSPSPLPQLN